MVKHPTSKRVHGDAEVEDAFVARVVEYSEWARRNTRIVTAAAVVLFIAVAAVLFWRNHQERLNTRAASRLTEIQQTVASGNTALAQQDLEGYLDTFSGTDPAGEARILLAQLYVDDGRFREALEAVEPLARDLDDPMGTPAAFLRAAAYEGMDQAGQAEQAYLSIADDAPLEFQQQRALAEAARIRMDQGNPGGAAEIYRRLVEALDEGHPERGIYQMRLAEAETAAAAGSAAAPSG
ncbi:MAG TPA: tetratricopeptide repeat protein [Longimicrobiales bacterium]|nr:tetratricopeptide repeat protein [Longimicrobiales bacterium]